MTKLKTIADLKKILNETKECDVLLFKHSKFCAVSAIAKSKFEKWLNENLFNPIVFLIDVNSERELSQQIQNHFEIKHESPQLICFRNGEIIWYASHFEISKANLNKYLSK